MTVRPVRPADAPDWLELRLALWPDSSAAHEADVAAFFGAPHDSVACFVAEDPDGGLVGFVETALRSYAEGCRTSPVGYIEGIFVVPTRRMSGVGRTLVTAAERWAVGRGCVEMASDRELANEPSGLFHASVGYREVERIVCFRKSLVPVEDAP
jgi:aminoglycoside 6'-N-acetyltransferase I